MPAFDPPKVVNGVPLSERSRQLLFTPIPWLMNPKKVFFSTPYDDGGWFREVFQRGAKQAISTGLGMFRVVLDPTIEEDEIKFVHAAPGGPGLDQPETEVLSWGTIRHEVIPRSEFERRRRA